MVRWFLCFSLRFQAPQPSLDFEHRNHFLYQVKPRNHLDFLFPNRAECWLAILDRLPTEARWSSLNTKDCEFRGLEKESRDNLFFSCQATAEVWKGILTKLRINRPTGDWHFEFASTISNMQGRSAPATVYKLVFTTFIYSIWREHNNGVFKRGKSTSSMMLQWILNLIRLQDRSLPSLVAKLTRITNARSYSAVSEADELFVFF